MRDQADIFRVALSDDDEPDGSGASMEELARADGYPPRVGPFSASSATPIRRGSRRRPFCSWGCKDLSARSPRETSTRSKRRRKFRTAFNA